MDCPLTSTGWLWFFSSAEMTSYPQLHQSFHRWSVSHCKMWFRTVPCALFRGWLGQRGGGRGRPCFDLNLGEGSKSQEGIARGGMR